MTQRAPARPVIPILPASGDEVEDQAHYVSMYQKRPEIYPRAVKGWFARWRWTLVWITQLFFYGMPWLQWDGRQALLFDLEAQRFYILGLVLYPQDLIFLAALLVLSALALFFFTAVAGRLWCGYACPQTVYTEIFMWVERRIEGDRIAGRKVGLLDRLLHALGEALVYAPLRDHLGLSRAERAYTAGEAIGEDTFLFFRALGLNLKQFYGQTENCALTAAQKTGDIQLNTVGLPLPGVELKIADDGEILLRADSVFDGYLNDDEASAKALAGGWLHTGDAGYVQPDGHLVVLGRVGEVVHTRQGERYIPTYIENRLKFSQYVKDAAVIGAGRQHLGALICIDMNAVGHWAEENGVTYTSYAELSQRPEVYQLIEGVITHVNSLLPEALAIRRFINLPKEFDPDDGEVTRTRKLRRNVIDEHYAGVIAALYDGSATVQHQARITYETGATGTFDRQLAIHNVSAS